MLDGTLSVNFAAFDRAADFPGADEHRTGRLQRDGKSVTPGVCGGEGVIGGQSGLHIRTGEVNGASVARTDVAEAVQGGHGHADRIAGRARGRGADGEL